MFNHRLTLCKYVHNAYMELFAPVLKSRDLKQIAKLPRMKIEGILSLKLAFGPAPFY